MPPPHDSDQQGRDHPAASVARRGGARRGQGRPLRFLALVLCLWAGGRLIALHGGIPTGTRDQNRRPTPPVARAASPGQADPALAALAMGERAEPREPLSGRSSKNRQPGPIAAHPVGRDSPPPLIAPLTASLTAPLPAPLISGDGMATRPAPSAFGPTPERPVTRPPPSPPSLSPPSRSPLPGGFPASSGGTYPSGWTHAAWVFWRDKASPAAIDSASDAAIDRGGQLGGAQIGFRTDRHLGDGQGPLPLSLYGRLSAALREPIAPETALGIAARPLSGRIAVTIGLERRIPLDHGGRSAFAVIAATGLNPTPIGAGINAEGYAQAGVVGFSRTDQFADGRLSLTTALDRDARSGAGFSLSGGAQPGIARLDIGPVLHSRLALGSVRPRLSVEWKQRIAGRAAPGSGPAITLAGDF
ncbi:MAG: hypothetical protein AB7E05_14165 [Sphingobium sp.]